MAVVNWGLLKHPMNYVTIFLMLVIAAIAGVLLMRLLKLSPATGNEE